MLRSYSLSFVLFRIAVGALYFVFFTLPKQSLALQAIESQSNIAAVAADRMDEPWWAARHESILRLIQQRPDAPLILVGDSITQNYEKTKTPDENFEPTWNEFYEPRHALNLGFSGDTTANLLWRIDHGEIEHLHPRVVVLLIGTNNTGHAHQTAEQTEVGIDAVVADLERRLPAAKVLLIALLPSQVSEQKSASDSQVNAYLTSAYGENPRVTFLDVGSIFLNDHSLNVAMFYDPRLPGEPKALHPDTAGQRKMAEAIEPTLSRLMGDEPRVPLASMTDINTALIPVERLEQDSYDWYARHHAELVAQHSIHPRLVLIGDSITHFWSGPPLSAIVNGRTAWSDAFHDMAALNLGFGWDRTQNVLWRLQHGEFDSLAPQWVVLNIGTNNLVGTANARANSPVEVAAGVSAIVDILQSRSPGSQIIVMAIFPRGSDPKSTLRQSVDQTNLLLAARLRGLPHVTYLDIGPNFLDPDGTVPASLMPDGTHPSDKGYKIWAESLINAGVKP